jgi:hypothetical protein
VNSLESGSCLGKGTGGVSLKGVACGAEKSGVWGEGVTSHEELFYLVLSSSIAVNY